VTSTVTLQSAAVGVAREGNSSSPAGHEVMSVEIVLGDRAPLGLPVARVDLRAEGVTAERVEGVFGSLFASA
jgi:hypothetical protein